MCVSVCISRAGKATRAGLAENPLGTAAAAERGGMAKRRRERAHPEGAAGEPFACLALCVSIARVAKKGLVVCCRCCCMRRRRRPRSEPRSLSLSLPTRASDGRMAPPKAVRVLGVEWGEKRVASPRVRGG